MSEKIITYKNFKPAIDDSVFIADGARVIGRVSIANNASIWFNTVLRGDVAPITVGANTNIQDGTIVHTSRYENGATVIGSNVTIGHLALIHACTIEDNAFVGMQATVMDQAKISSWGFLGAGSLLTPGKIIKPYEMWVGRPASFIRNITEQELNFMQENVISYVELAKQYYKSDIK